MELGDASIEGTGEGGDPARVRFPDGNATIARLLVSRLIPDSTSARAIKDSVTARFAYRSLDSVDSATRIRLNRTVVRAAHRDLGALVDVTYVREGRAHTVSASNAMTEAAIEPAHRAVEELR